MKKITLSSFVIVGLLCVAFLVPSCRKQQTHKLRFAIVANGSARFWDLARSGMYQAAQEENVDWEFFMPGESSAAQQKQILETVLAKNYDGMAISVINPQTMIRLIDEITAAMTVICIDSDASQSRRLLYVGTGNVLAGRVAGGEMKKALPKGGEVAVFVGKLDVANARERYQGVLETIKGSNYQIVELFTDQTDRTIAQANVRTALAKYPHLKGIIGLWCYNGPAAIAVLKDSPGHDVKVVGFDEESTTLEAIRSGQMVCSIASTSL
jgi:ribose transport system substrate-binding protein